MNLYYVDHSIMVTQRFALLAVDQDELNAIIAAREAKVLTMFKSKVVADKSGKPLVYPLSADWDGGCSGPPWDGK